MLSTHARICLLALISFFAYSLISDTTALAQKVNITSGEWEGVYYYDPKNRPKDESAQTVTFALSLAVTGDSFSGKIKEPRTFGNPDSEFLFADMLGRINSDLTFMFIKKYDGTAGVTHSIYYVGKLNPKNMRVEGNWSIDKSTGKFSMAPKK